MTRLPTAWRHLVWDMGGTMIDTYPQVDHALYRVCRVHGCEIDDGEISRLTRVSIAEAGEELARRCGIPVREFVTAYARLKQGWKTDPPPVMEGARQLLAAVRERGGLNLVVTHRDRESAEDLLAAHRLEVDDMICAPDGFPRKPDPTMHHLVVEQNGLNPGECLAVGDRAIDSVAAGRAGLPWVLLVTPGLPVPRVEGEGTVIHRLAELLE
ncbi:HAD family hydrolase [Granulicoccus sp. GXG6511]|uniref:HAD family hydrolase n=1 Tax=Granulicoccus sp. GXG6511 TaxID=3381351 RepID=UPI003D7CB466